MGFGFYAVYDYKNRMILWIIRKHIDFRLLIDSESDCMKRKWSSAELVMKRILVIGCSGSGKSTLSRELSRRLNLPLIHLDNLFWKPGWVAREKADFKRLLKVELKKDSWIIDGNFARTMALRVHYADTVIFLDFNRWICFWRVTKRWLLHGGEMQAVGCPQKVDFPFLQYIWKYRKKERLEVLNIMGKNNGDLQWITLTNPSEVKQWLRNGLQTRR